MNKEFLIYILYLVIAFFVVRWLGPSFVKREGKTKEQIEEDTKIISVFLKIIFGIVLVVFIYNLLDA